MQVTKSTFRRLMDNFLSLSAVQGINMLIPLITFPYLVRVLGVDQFGVFSFVMAVLMYGIIITDYGFELTGTKHISTNIGNQAKIDEIFSSVIMIRSVIAILFFLFLLLLITFVDKFSENSILYILGFGIIVGQALLSTWFFQGIEKIHYVAILNAASKILFAVMIFIFVHSKEDLYLVFLFNSIGAIMAGVMAFYIAVKKFGVTFSFQSKEQYLYYLKDAWHIFTARVAVQLYQSINIIILGFYVDNTMLGYFSIVDRIVRAGGNIIASAPRAVYPYLAKTYKESVSKFYQLNVQVSFALLFLVIPVAGLGYYFSVEILSFFTDGKPADIIVQLFHISILLFVTTPFGTHFTNSLVILNETKFLNKVVISAGVINLMFVFSVINYFGVVGLALFNLFIGFVVIVTTKGYYIFFKFRKRDLG